MASQKLVYDIGDRPKIKNLFLYSLQLLLAILAATIAFPTAVGLPIQIPSAILGAGLGTLVYIIFTKGKSPIVISSNFSFLGAFPTAIAFGYTGIVIGGLLSGLVYVIIAIVVKFAHTKWVSRLMPPVIIGPIVTLIGLGLAPNAIGDIVTANSSDLYASYNWVAILCGLITFFVVVLCTVQNKKKSIKLVPFIIGIGVGYVMACIFTGIGNAVGNSYLKIIDFSPLTNNFTQLEPWRWFISTPNITLVESIKELSSGSFTEAIKIANGGVDPTMIDGAGFATIMIAFCPIALVTFAEHLADHKNMSTIINHDLINEQPGLGRTLLGDGVGSMVGTAFGLCPNTSYGESIACVALTRNASVITTFTTACMCIALSFLAPFSALLQTIPHCVMGGVCLSLYGYISVSGLKMFKEVDLDDNANLLTVCTILIVGIGGLVLKIPPIKIQADQSFVGFMEVGSLATALLMGIAVYNIAKAVSGKEKSNIAEVNKEIKYEDLVRAYLKRFSVDDLAKGLLIFGFIHENVDFTVATLSNFLRSDEILNLRTEDELREIIRLFELRGYKNTMNKQQLIELIKLDCNKIDQNLTHDVVGSEIN